MFKHPQVMFFSVLLVICIGEQEGFAQLPPLMKYKVILADEGNGKVHYINLANPAERWTIATPNRDIQLIGNDRLMVSVGDGYAEYNVTTGALIKKVTTGGTVQSVFRLSPNTTFIGVDGSPASIKVVDSTGKQIRKINLATIASVRIVRPSNSGTFLIGGTRYECDSTGVIKWEAKSGGDPYMSLRLPNGNTVFSNGYGGQMVLVDAQAKVLKQFPAAADKNGSAFWSQAAPNFFAGFQVLKNGNIVVSNWQGHGGGNGGKGFQLIEIDSGLTQVVSYWKQDPAIVSSLHGVLVLDSLDTKVLHSDVNGILAPVQQPVAVLGVSLPGVSFTRTAGHDGSLVGMFRLDGRSITGLPHRPVTGVYIRQREVLNDVNNRRCW